MIGIRIIKYILLEFMSPTKRRMIGVLGLFLLWYYAFRVLGPLPVFQSLMFSVILTLVFTFITITTGVGIGLLHYYIKGE